MAEVTFRANLKLATATLEAIERAVEEAVDDGLRPHLGASLIGRPCERALWYVFRWARASRFEGRMLRLFARGQREEDAIAALLRAAGIDVVQADPDTGEQYRFAAGHFGGSMDGAVHGLPEAPHAWHVLECKTHGAKSFNDLAAKGVQAAKPEHWAQMQCYMHWTGMERALYAAVCKDDDRLHLERIEYDRAEAERLFAKAQRIIAAPEPPPGISEDPAWWQCKLCDYHALCHGTALPLPTCRACAHATPRPEGTWWCERHGKGLDVPEQKAGCDGHRYIPVLLARSATVEYADTEANWVSYKHRETGAIFFNAAPPEDGWSSAELHALQDKRMLGDPGADEIRCAFDARCAA
jgi:hypothetical protein